MKETDRYEKKRTLYDQKIIEKEREIEEIRQIYYQITDELEELDITMTKGFRRLQALNDELIVQGSHQAKWEQEENQGKYSYISKFLRESSHDLKVSYQDMMKNLEEDRIQLQNERNQLPWD